MSHCITLLFLGWRDRKGISEKYSTNGNMLQSMTGTVTFLSS